MYIYTESIYITKLGRFGYKHDCLTGNLIPVSAEVPILLFFYSNSKLQYGDLKCARYCAIGIIVWDMKQKILNIMS